MRKNRTKHEAKKPRLAKRALALCFALIFVCSCLLPAFANGDVATFEAPAAEEEQTEETGEPVTEDLYGTDDQTNVPTTQPGGGINMGGGIVVGDGDTTGGTTGGMIRVDDDPSGNIVYINPNVTESDEVLTPSDDPADSVIISRPEGEHALDKVDAGFSLPTNIYHFWLKEMNSNDLADISSEAASRDMTVEQYLAMYGKDTGCYHIMTAADGADLNDYKFANPTFLDDSEGRDFAGWYTVDEFGDKHDFTFDQTLFISSGTTVEVFAKWVEADIDGNTDADAEDTETGAETDEAKDPEKKPVVITVDKVGTASLSVDGDTKTLVSVRADGLPDTVDKLEVLDLESEESADAADAFGAAFATSTYSEMVSMLGLNITPKNIDGKTVQPSGTVRVTVSNLNKMGLIVEDVSTLKMLHLTKNNEIEALDVENVTTSYDSNGNTVLDGFTFETTSFSPFALMSSAATSVEPTALNLDEYPSTKDLYTSYGYNRMITVGESIVVKCDGNNHQWGRTYEWRVTEGDNSIIKIVETKDNVARIEAISTGWATISHGYYHTYKKQTYWQNDSTYKLYVADRRGDQKADIFFLKTPNTGAEKNDASYWLPQEWKDGEWKSVLAWQVDNTDMDGTVNTTGATWDDRNKNIMLNASGNAGGTYVTGWPDGSTESTWTLYRNCTVDDNRNKELNQDVFKEVLDSIWDAYQAELASDLGVSADTLKKEQITQITLIPYKLSSNSTMHIDCTISATGIAYTAKFWVEEPGETGYKQVYSKNYKNNENVKEPTSQEMVDWTYNNDGKVSLIKSQGNLPETYTVNGVTYRFDGWYPEGNPNDTIPDLDKEKVTFEYTPSDIEKQNGVVNFYARYVPVGRKVYVTKKVTGLFGERTKSFAFKLLNGTASEYEFTLSHGQTKCTDKNDNEIQAIAGDKLTIEEKNSEGYKVTVRITKQDGTKIRDIPYEGDASTAEKTINFEIGADDVPDGELYITVINDKDGPVDNGVLLDTLPYLIILGIAVAGAAALLIRKKKHDDE